MYHQKLSTSIFFTYHLSPNFIFKAHIQKYLYLLEFLVPFSKANQYRSKNQKNKVGALCSQMQTIHLLGH
jgi:hypothetical protein